MGKTPGSSRDAKKAAALRIPFTLEEIVHSSIEEFHSLQKPELTESQWQLIQDIRRRGKNKVAAQNCRKRKTDEITELYDEVCPKEHMLFILKYPYRTRCREK